MLNFKRLVVAGAVATVASGVPMMNAHASFTVLPGWDLLITQPGTRFTYNNTVIPMTGAPDLISSQGCGAAQFNFGSGCTGIGNTSALLYRPQTATGAANASAPAMPVEFQALGLRSVNQVDLGRGLEYLTAVLLRDLGSTMQISFNDTGSGGAFDSLLNFTARVSGDISGVLFDDTFSFTQTDPLDPTSTGKWTRDPTGVPLLLAGVNYQLNGSDSTDDFFSGLVEHCGPTNKCHDTTSIVPVPAAAPLLLSGLLGLGFLARRRKGS